MFNSKFSQCNRCALVNAEIRSPTAVAKKKTFALCLYDEHLLPEKAHLSRKSLALNYQSPCFDWFLLANWSECFHPSREKVQKEGVLPQYTQWVSIEVPVEAHFSLTFRMIGEGILYIFLTFHKSPKKLTFQHAGGPFEVFSLGICPGSLAR